MLKIRALFLIVAFSLTGTLAQAIELVMVDRVGCHYCEAWKAEIGPAYPNSTEGRFAPLEVIEARHLSKSGIALTRPVIFTPTFLLTHEGRELSRLEGYPGDDFFWFHLTNMLNEHTNFKAYAAQF